MGQSAMPYAGMISGAAKGGQGAIAQNNIGPQSGMSDAGGVGSGTQMNPAALMQLMQARQGVPMQQPQQQSLGQLLLQRLSQ